MKIALFTETYVGSINGVMTHIKILKDGLEALGHQVLIVSADKHCKHHYMEDGILHCPAMEAKRFYGFGIALPYSRKRQRLIAGFAPDVIHIHHEFGVGLSGIYAARLLRKPLVYTLHTMYDHYVYYIAPKVLVRLATKVSHRYERFIARRATALTSPSTKGNEYFKRIGVNKEINLIPNAIDLAIFNPAGITSRQKGELREKLGVPPKHTLAAFVGRLGKEKGIDTLLRYWAESVREADGLHLLIVGEGPEKDALERQAEALQINSMVTFAGLVKHDKLPACLACCDAYVTASLSDNHSISMLEGMALGLPTLQLYDELNADQIVHGVNGYHFHTAREMADRLREIRALPPEGLAALKDRVIESVRHRGCTELASFMLAVYQKAIQEKEVP